MKKKIHPKWYPETKVTCACGHSFVVGSTVPEIQVEICAACHPFFTGEMKFIDTLGRVEKFQKKQAAAKGRKTKKQKRAEAKEKESKRPRTLKEMLEKPTGKTTQ